MSTLARQQAAPGNKGSLVRLNQLTDQLEEAFDATWGKGVIKGGFVNRTGNFAVSVESTDTILFAYGKKLTLASDLAYSPIPDHATVYLWGEIVRTAADPTVPGDEDTYALVLTPNTTGTAPDADHFLFAGPIDAAGGIGAQADINNVPDGKYLPIAREISVATETVAIPKVDKWYIVTADFSAVGLFPAKSAFSADPGSVTAGVIAHELPSHKGAGKAAWLVMLPNAVGAAGNFDFTPILYGFGFSGTDFTAIAATWAITVAALDEVNHTVIAVDPGAAGADIADLPIFVGSASGVTLSKIGIVPQETPAGIDAGNTAVVAAKDAAGNTIVTKTYNNVTVPPAVKVYDNLGSLDATHKILTANEVVTISITQGATANLGSILIVLEWRLT